MRLPWNACSQENRTNFMALGFQAGSAIRPVFFRLPSGECLLSTIWSKASDFSRKNIQTCAEGAHEPLNPLTLVGGGSVFTLPGKFIATGLQHFRKNLNPPTLPEIRRGFNASGDAQCIRV